MGSTLHAPKLFKIHDKSPQRLTPPWLVPNAIGGLQRGWHAAACGRHARQAPLVRRCYTSAAAPTQTAILFLHAAYPCTMPSCSAVTFTGVAAAPSMVPPANTSCAPLE